MESGLSDPEQDARTGVPRGGRRSCLSPPALSATPLGHTGMLLREGDGLWALGLASLCGKPQSTQTLAITCDSSEALRNSSW